MQGLASGILIIGIVQGIFLSVSLGLHKEGPKKANRFLIGLLLSFVVALAVHYVTVTGQWTMFVKPYVFASSVVFLFGPLLCLYTQTLTQRNYRLKWQHLAHLLPWLTNLGLFIPLLLTPEAKLLEGINSAKTGAESVDILTWLKVGHVTVYCFYVLYYLQQHKRRMAEQFSELDKVSFAWLSHLIGGFVFLAVMMIGVLLLGIDLSSIAGVDSLFSLVLVILIFVTGFKGLQQPDIFRQEPKSEVSSEKYIADNLNSTDVDAIKRSLQELEQQKFYLDRFIDLTTLAKKLQVSNHQLSQFLNQELNVSFYDYVNQLRIVEAKRLLLASELSILDVGLESGFNNKTTFNKAFKKYVQQTPSQFKFENQ